MPNITKNHAITYTNKQENEPWIILMVHYNNDANVLLRRSSYRVCKYLFIEVRKHEMYACIDELVKIN